MSRSRPTIHDVARHAGVSATTVSHVLNGRGRVNADTRERVNAAAEELDYRANPLARHLRHDRFGALGLYLPEHSLSVQFYVDIALSASQTAFAHGCGLTLLPAIADTEQLRRLPLDGVIVAEPLRDDPVVEALAAARIPLVLCEAAPWPTGPSVRRLEYDHDAAMAGLLDHLVNQGARDIVVVGSDTSVWWGESTQRAVAAWNARRRRRRAAARWVGMPFVCTPDEARATVDDVLDDVVPDALVIGQQGLAGAALAAAAARGLSVPGDLLVACGVDGPDLLSAVPTVTALDLRPREAGALAAELLLGERTGTVVPVPVDLVVRGSTTR